MGSYFEYNNTNFYIYSICCILISGGCILAYIRIRALYPSPVKRSFLYLMLLGIFPVLMTGWIGMLVEDYANILMSLCLYLMGFSILLLRQHALIFLREMPKSQNQKNISSELKIMQEIKDQSVLCIIGITYFFLMGTLFLINLF